MNLSGKRFFSILTFVLLAMLAVGCQGPSKRIYALSDGEIYAREWVDVVREKPIAKDEDVSLIPLFSDENSSCYILQVNDAEEPHIHEKHDLTLILKRGEGTLNLRDRVLPMNAGDVAFIPRGAPHWFVNDKKGSAAIAFLVFSPSFDGKGTRPFYLPGF